MHSLKNRFLPKWHVRPFLIHFLVWLFVYLFPIILISTGQGGSWKTRYWTTVPFLITLILFYINYLYLIPKFLFAKRFKIYVVLNIILFFLVFVCSELWREYATKMGFHPEFSEPSIPTVLFIKAFVGLTLVLGIAVSIRFSSAWFTAESIHQKAQLENLHSELSLLKMQISPHFLFNTLNNILVLIDENAELAKKSIQQLSNLLRTMLYEAEVDTVPIKQEVVFLHNYANLMLLRYGDGLRFSLTSDSELAEPNAPIAPLLLIPLLENVFKHGVCAGESSEIKIKISSQNGKIIYESENTYFPKTHTDKSGSGIGLTNMLKRLELLYEGKYTYDSKIAGGKYLMKLEVEV